MKVLIFFVFGILNFTVAKAEIPLLKARICHTERVVARENTCRAGYVYHFNRFSRSTYRSWNSCKYGSPAIIEYPERCYTSDPNRTGFDKFTEIVRNLEENSCFKLNLKELSELKESGELRSAFLTFNENTGNEHATIRLGHRTNYLGRKSLSMRVQFSKELFTAPDVKTDIIDLLVLSGYSSEPNGCQIIELNDIQNALDELERQHRNELDFDNMLRQFSNIDPSATPV